MDNEQEVIANQNIILENELLDAEIDPLTVHLDPVSPIISTSSIVEDDPIENFFPKVGCFSRLEVPCPILLKIDWISLHHI